LLKSEFTNENTKKIKLNKTDINWKKTNLKTLILTNWFLNFRSLYEIGNIINEKKSPKINE